MRKERGMKRARRATRLVRTLCAAPLCAFLILAMTLSTGCRRAANENETVATSPEPAPEALPGLTAEKLLREAAKAYANAKYYADDGYSEIVYERESDHARQSTRIPCSLRFAKPNYARMELGRGLLRSDGRTIRAEILDDAFAGQVKEKPAPLMITSIREFYPDPEFAAAANLAVPSDFFWTSPQLALLFSRDPFRTLAPLDASLKLLDPAYLRFDEPETDDEPSVLCDRVEVDGDDGARVYWFVRATRALARCELPAERLMAPERASRVLAARVEFPNQTLLQYPPEDLAEFQYDESEKDAVRLVDQFESPELFALEKEFPLETVRRFDDGGADAGTPEKGVATALCFWRVEDETRAAALGALSRLAQEYPDAAFYAVNADGPSLDDRDAYAEGAALAPKLRQARLDGAEFMRQASDLPALVTPSTVLLDESGRIVRVVWNSPETSSLRGAFRELENGRDPVETARRESYENARRFNRFMESALNGELYRTTLKSVAHADEIPPRQMTKTTRLHEVWRYSGLFAPANPIAVSSAPRGSAEKDGNWETIEANEEERPEHARDDMLVVPCDGNALAILTPRGKLVRKTTPAAFAGEPISFVRTVEFGEGRRYFVASASGTSRKLHRFDENFNDLGSLEVGSAFQRVGDARFADANGDGTPELFLSVVSAPDAPGSLRNGVYAIDMETRRVLWKDESVLAPSRLAVETPKDGEERPTICRALDYTKPTLGAIASYDASTGTPLPPPRVKENATLRTIAAAEHAPQGGARFVAIGSDPDVTYFFGYDRDGNELWRNVIPPMKDEIAERLVAGDVDGDGFDEWLVVSGNGVIRFFSASGVETDVFQYGAEITGACVARWNNESYLIVTEASRVSAWRFDRIRRQKKE